MFGFTITDLSDVQLKEWADVLNELFAANVFKSRIAKELRLDDAAEAHRLAEGDALAGKIVLRCD